MGIPNILLRLVHLLVLMVLPGAHAMRGTRQWQLLPAES